MSAPLYLIDASIYIFRAYYSIPDTFIGRDGQSVNAVYGYTNFVLDLWDRAPEYISFAFDESLNTCYRNKIYPDYKANRDLPDANLAFQLQKCQEVTRLLGFHCLSLHDYEADDIIGTLQKKLAKERPCILVTRDKDLGQLLRAEDLLWDFAADDYAGPADVKKKFGVEAAQIADYLALAGDAVDNIPGAPGIGAKSAAAILAKFSDIDDLYQRIEDFDAVEMRGVKKAKQTLIDHEANVRMFRQITEIACDIDLEVSLDDLAVQPAGAGEIESFCDELSFGQRMRERLNSAITKGDG
jgi:DNA polymerase-1